MYMFILGSCNVCAVCQSRDVPGVQHGCGIAESVFLQPHSGYKEQRSILCSCCRRRILYSVIISLLKFLFMSSKSVCFKENSTSVWQFRLGRDTANLLFPIL